MLPSISDRPGSGADRTVIVRDEGPTALMPQVPPVRPPGVMRRLLPWVGVGLLAVAVVGGTTVWSAGLRSNAAPEVPIVVSVPAARATTSAAPTATTAARTADRVVEQVPTTARRVAPPPTTARTTTTASLPETTAATSTGAAARAGLKSMTNDPYGLYGLTDATDTAVDTATY